MTKIFLRKGDQVQVISGANKGHKGEVLKVLREKNRVIIEGAGMIKKHTKPSAQNPQGGITETEAPIHISNVALVDPKTGNPTRIGYEIKDGKKVRIAKKSGQEI